MNIQTTDQQENDMMKATNKFPLEISVIHGTLRNQDLIPAFLVAVLQLDPDTPIGAHQHYDARRTTGSTAGQ
jgi:hypothetical protein